MALLLILGIVLLCMPVYINQSSPSVIIQREKALIITQELHEYSGVTERKEGILDPVLIEHTGRPSVSQIYSTARTDTTKYPQSETQLTSGDAENLYSAHCAGGYFLVGDAGFTDFGTPEGTISLWIKWDDIAPNGRFWGQEADFETRWSNGRLILDWGNDNTFSGIKNTWLTDKWYFIAISWNQNTNSLIIYWGDENNLPIVDRSTSTWIGSVLGLLDENNIMCSRGYSSGIVNGYVDDFRYYSVQRNFEDIQADYNTPLIGNEEFLEHYYNFENGLDDDAGDSDLIQNGNTLFSEDTFYRFCGWRGEQLNVRIRNLRQLFALNGSYDTGYPGTNENPFWNEGEDGIYYAEGWRARYEKDPNDSRQRTSYSITDPRYTSIENEGYEDGSSPDAYRHYNNTVIYWYQLIENYQHVEIFKFSMNYLYQRGPIGTNYADNFEFCFEVLSGTSLLWNWSIDPTNISQRGVWFSVDPITLEISNAPTVFEVRIVLKVNTASSYIEISESDPDLDGDPANARYLTFQIDDLSFVASDPPSFENVELAITVSPLETTFIQGIDGTGTISLEYRYWEQSVISFSFSSNTTISFEYLVKITKMTKQSNSTFSLNLDNIGTLFKANLNLGVELSFYTYIQSYPGISDLGFIVHYPKDWQDPVVEDPFGQDITAETCVLQGVLEIPSGLADTVGWWKVQLTGVNYISSIINEQRTDQYSHWIESSILRNGEQMRSIATLSDGIPTTIDILDATFSWFTPVGDLWYSINVSSRNSTFIASPAVIFSSTNSSIGTWLITVYWINGTEVAYGSSSFDIYHRLTIFPKTPSIEIESGEEFTAAVFLYDQDTGIAILSGASVNGNWSTENIQFNPNLAKGWYEADFNSSFIGTGDFVILVTVELPYYDLDYCTINLRIPVAESLYMITLRASILGAVVVIIAFCIMTVSQRLYTMYTTTRQFRLFALKGRLEDAKNLIGLLVIHRSIGLPIYSKIIKGGFQESLLSSFISALSQFRAEFSWDEPKWTALPVTEVITVVLTDSLICAMITVEGSSSNQKTQLELFGRELGNLYDQDDDTIKKMTYQRELSNSLDSSFDTYFDWPLLRRYIGIKDDLPKKLLPVKNILEKMHVEKGVTVDALIKDMLLAGYKERRVYEIILEAVDGSYLIPVEQEDSTSSTIE